MNFILRGRTGSYCLLSFHHLLTSLTYLEFGNHYSSEPESTQRVMIYELRRTSTSVELVEGWCLKWVRHIREIWLGQTTVDTKTELSAAARMNALTPIKLWQKVTTCHQMCLNPTIKLL